MLFEKSVVTDFDWENLEDQVRKMLNEIAQLGGRGSHGSVTLTDTTQCEHRRAGDYRIFGNYESADDKFHVIGWGEHTGTKNKKYKVYLDSGKSTRATTS